MDVLQANQQVYEALNGWNNDGHTIEFCLDSNGNYILNTDVLFDPYFEKIHDELNSLPRIPFAPYE